MRLNLNFVISISISIAISITWMSRCGCGGGVSCTLTWSQTNVGDATLDRSAFKGCCETTVACEYRAAPSSPIAREFPLRGVKATHDQQTLNVRNHNNNNNSSAAATLMVIAMIIIIFYTGVTLRSRYWAAYVLSSFFGTVFCELFFFSEKDFTIFLIQ